MTALPVSASVDDRTSVAIWLLVCCVMIFAMVVLGGVTRLTGSGLSMVDWRPIMGTLPPLSEAEWQETFAQYKNSPEFRKTNFWMTLADFKGIFWFEYIHRVWGRAIGIVYAAPFVYFLLRRRIDRGLAIKLLIGFVVGGLQGVLGWVMVRSGLVDRPDVSQYRLAAHLALAIVIYGYLLWIALDILARGRDGARARPGGFALFFATWTFLTAVTGAFVAGLDGGHVYNTFPLMDGRIVPEAMFQLDPWIINFFENVAAVQFTHRVFAITLVVLALALWWRARGRLAAWVAIAAVLQACLGIATLLTEVETWLAATHQAGAMVVFTLALWIAHAFRDRA